MSRLPQNKQFAMTIQIVQSLMILIKLDAFWKCLNGLINMQVVYALMSAEIFCKIFEAKSLKIKNKFDWI